MDLRSFGIRRNLAEDPDPVIRVRGNARMAILGGFIALGYLLLIGRASALMLLPDPRLEGKARLQFEQTVKVEGRRGDIVDRNGHILATTVELGTLHIDPSILNDQERQMIANTIAPVLGQDPSDVSRRLARTNRRDVVLARELTPEKGDQISNLRENLAIGDPDDPEDDHPSIRSAIQLKQEPHRFYPGRHLAGPLIGLVSHTGQGTAGLERSADTLLRGTRYKYVEWRDRLGRRITPEQALIPAGQNLVLSLDQRIQHLADQAVADAVERTKASAGYAVVVHVETGELLAMSNWPTQNINEREELDLTMLKNRAAMDAIEPGSVFKPFIAAAALEEGLIEPDTLIDCEQGRWSVGGGRIRDDHGQGVVTITDVIKKSSNIGAAKLAFKLGKETTIAYLERFGFGRPTGLELPGETRGFIRSAATIKPIELATTAFGQGATANAIQLAYATAALGNNGARMRPILIKEIRNEHDDVVVRNQPTVELQVVSPETAQKVVAMMETVTQEGGTGRAAQVPGFRVAGKTGTAQKADPTGGYSETDRIGSWVGLIPAEDPKLAIVVVIDTPTEGDSYGGVVAAPAFAEIAEGSLRLMGVMPNPALLPPPEVDLSDLDDGIPYFMRQEIENTPRALPDLTWTQEGNFRTPNLTGLSLRDTYAVLQGAGLAIHTSGTGRVVSQIPLAGSTIRPGEQVEVVLQ
jgi:cell division protein FtsI (penicillin-binding protein 3)